MTSKWECALSNLIHRTSIFITWKWKHSNSRFRTNNSKSACEYSFTVAGTYGCTDKDCITNLYYYTNCTLKVMIKGKITF